MREGLPLPTKIANAPELQMGLELYYDAFWELDTCRPAVFGLGRIPWLAVREYSVAFEFDTEQSDWLYHLIRVLDGVYLKHHAPKIKKGKKWQPPRHSGS